MCGAKPPPSLPNEGGDPGGVGRPDTRQPASPKAPPPGPPKQVPQGDRRAKKRPHLEAAARLVIPGFQPRPALNAGGCTVAPCVAHRQHQQLVAWQCPSLTKTCARRSERGSSGPPQPASAAQRPGRACRQRGRACVDRRGRSHSEREQHCRVRTPALRRPVDSAVRANARRPVTASSGARFAMRKVSATRTRISHLA